MQLGALTKDHTYQVSFSALVSIGEGDDEFAMHRNLCQEVVGPISPKQVVREAQPDKLAGHVNGGSLLHLPWLGPVRGEKAQEE